MVTVELAAGLPVVVLVLAVMLSALMAGIDQLRVTDAARVAARAAARGDASDQVLSLARRDAPTGAHVTVDAGRSDISVSVHAPVRGGLHWVFGGWHPHATVIEPREPTSCTDGVSP